MCEFEVIARESDRYMRLRCIASAGIAMHLRASDIIHVTGTNMRRLSGKFFAVESIRGSD